MFRIVAMLVGAKHSGQRKSILEWPNCEWIILFLIHRKKVPFIGKRKLLLFQLMLSGILGLIVIGFKRIPRHKLRQHFFTFLRINSSFVTSVAAVCTLLASTFAILHLITIMSPSTVCTPSRLLVASSECTCRYGESASNVTISTSGFNLDGTYYR